jgi:hypothetical protein
MDRSEYWKNFKLGKELDISGRFIYNGLQCFHHMEHFCYEEEIFEFLYNVSVGIERLLKVCVILIEHSDAVDQKEFEKSLITHNHQELLKRVKAKHSIGFSTAHNDFIQIIGKFYKSHRYGRYDLEAMKAKDEEKIQLHAFIEKHLKLKIDDETMFAVTRNDVAIKKFIGKTIGKISEELFKIVELEAGRLNIYTYEIRYGSKASKIFTFKKYDFFDEDILWKELLIFFVNSSEESGQIKFIKSIEPLDFDPALASDYMECFASDVKKLAVMDELESLCENLDDHKDRKAKLEVVGNPNVYFRDEEDDEFEE